MSLINKVLKQIENKHDPGNITTGDDSTIPPSFSSPTLKTDRNKIILLLSLLVVFFVVVIISTLSKCTKTKSHATTQITKPAAVKAIPLKKQLTTSISQTNPKPAQILPIQLVDMSINVINDKTTLTLGLNQTTLYYLEHDDSQKHLTLTLSNTGIQTKPALNFTHTAIKTLTTKQVNNNTVINIEVLPETQVIGLQLYSQPKTQLQLVLLNSSTPKGTVNKIISSQSNEQVAAQEYQKSLDLISENKTDLAINELQQALQKDPKNKKIRETLATIMITDNDLDEASAVLEKGLYLNPYYSKFSELLAYVYIQQGQLNKATSILEQNSPNISTNTNYYGMLANLYQRSGKYMEAARIYDQLTRTEPNNGKWWVGLGVAFESANKKNAALEAYQSAIYTGNLTPEIRGFIEDKVKNR